ncbi:hypothetical protein F4553_001372 [Allocatelliglobosispora scoriae]|uniref:Secreted protein n=1 Tax=Allocatelliglobosispora scoriae TaxID=643052 RepID=A0A841BLZ3_9ACTN|nr:hypothetical protein [Allocatelliglobosispora scoriae]MBB5867993.1 hypothetical protein [Allocatelliglobosispora scoriae]
MSQWRLPTILTAATAALALLGSPAMAAHDDSFSASTPGGCGVADFVDYGTWGDGSKKDDFIVLHDYCSDSKGIFVMAWLNGNQVGGLQNSNGYAGKPTMYKPWDDVKAGDRIAMQVCLTWSYAACLSGTYSEKEVRTSQDG